tara:strand:- start:940 stop:1089 length:150 start_codon:yes stop_codon:yes gene_type:complete
MYRLIKLVVVLAIGFSAGVSYDRWQMRKECANGEGEWRDTICLNSDLEQ